MTSQACPVWRATHTSSMRVQPLLLVIRKWAWDLDLKCMWLLDNQSTFDLCCNPDFAHNRRDAKRAMHMSSNGGGLHISKECKVPGYDFWVWFTKRAMTIASRTSSICYESRMIASAGQHSLFTGRSLVFPIWCLICILVGCTFAILKRSMDNMVLSKLLLII